MSKRITTPYDLTRAGKRYRSDTPYDLNCRRSYDKEYLKKLRKKAAWIKDVDADEYLNEIRGRK